MSINFSITTNGQQKEEVARQFCNLDKKTLTNDWAKQLL